MKILVCGGRNQDEQKVFDALLTWIDQWEVKNNILITEIIHGGAYGADSAAGGVALFLDLTETVFKADWKEYGNAAGPIRNKKMLTEGQPDAIVSFPGGIGTAGMVRLAEYAGVPVYKIEGDFS